MGEWRRIFCWALEHVLKELHGVHDALVLEDRQTNKTDCWTNVMNLVLVPTMKSLSACLSVRSYVSHTWYLRQHWPDFDKTWVNDASCHEDLTFTKLYWLPKAGATLINWHFQVTPERKMRSERDNWIQKTQVAFFYLFSFGSPSE
jgi:hypothetical protein